MYLEQQFVTSEGFVRAVVLSRQSVVLPEQGRYPNVTRLMEAALKREGSTFTRPERPKDLEHLCNCIETSSAKLRKRD